MHYTGPCGEMASRLTTKSARFLIRRLQVRPLSRSCFWSACVCIPAQSVAVETAIALLRTTIGQAEVTGILKKEGDMAITTYFGTDLSLFLFQHLPTFISITNSPTIHPTLTYQTSNAS